MMAEESESVRKQRAISCGHVTITMPSPDQGAKSVSKACTNAVAGKEDKIILLKEQVETEDQETEFRDKLVKVSLGPLKELQEFMANTDEYPRFVCEKVVLSFAQLPMETFEASAVKKFYRFLDRFIEFYPDIFQRELLRDGLQLADRPDRPDRYGILHAVALIGKTNLVHLLRGRNKYARQVIFNALIPDDVSDSFHLVRRALLWRHMMSISYEEVAATLRDVEKARKSTEPKALEKLIAQAAAQFDPTDSYDPWVVILAWFSVSKEHNLMLKEFQKSQRDIFEGMITKLGKRGSPFTHFLREDSAVPEETVKITLHGNKEVEVKRTVQDMVKILILQKDTADYISSYKNVQNISRTRSCFLDRFCARIPDSLWSPLHFAAARGDHDMVSALIDSWKLIVERLDEERKKTYTRKLEESFYDARCMTPLHYGVLRNNKEVVNFLVHWEMFNHHVNKCDIFMRTAFQMACSKDERASIVQQLVTNPRVDVNTKDCCKFTSLHWVVHVEAIETVKHVIFDGKNRAIRALEKDRENRSPYDMAARGSKRSHREIEQLLLNHTAVKDLVERLYRDRQVYVYASNAILVSAALIASVTFGGWLQPPAGSDRNVLIFWVCNGLSFFFAIATLTSGAAAMLPVGNEYIKDAVETIRGSLIRTSFLLILSVTCVLGAFAAAGFASLSKILNRTAPDFNNKTTTIITVSIGGFVCGTIGLDFCERLSRVRPDWLEQAFKGTFKVQNKKDILRTVHSLIHLPLKVFRLLREQIRADSSEPEKSKSDTVFGPENTPVLKTLLEMAEEAKTTHPFRPLSRPSFSDRCPPIEVDRTRIETMLAKIHPQDNIKSCPVRTHYNWLEIHCLEDILQPKLILDKEQPLGEYRLMWKRLAQQPVRALSSSNLVTSAKASESMSQVTDLKLPSPNRGRDRSSGEIRNTYQSRFRILQSRRDRG